MSRASSSPRRILNPFKKAATAKQPNNRTATPFSLRFTPEERAWLDEQAGYRPLGDYIRAKVLGDMAQRRRVLRKPKVDDEQLAVILAELGQSRLASNLNQLAKQANSGTLELSTGAEVRLAAACEAVLVMRDALLVALGQRPKPRTGG